MHLNYLTFINLAVASAQSWSAAPLGAQSRFPSANQSQPSSIGSSRIPSSFQSMVPSTNPSRASSRAASRPLSGVSSRCGPMSTSANAAPPSKLFPSLPPPYAALIRILDNPEPDAAPENQRTSKRSRRHTSKPYSKEGDKSTLQSYYQGNDLRLIKTALSHLYLHMSLEQPFPKFVDDSHKAVFNGFVQKAIEQLAKENAAVTEGKYLPRSFSSKLKDARYYEKPSSRYCETCRCSNK